MNKSDRSRLSKLLVTSLLLLLTLAGFLFIHTQNNPTDANQSEKQELQTILIRKPAHAQIYKIGTEANYQEAFQAANQRKQGQHKVRNNEMQEEIRLAEEKQAKEKAEEEKIKQEQAAKEKEQAKEESPQEETKTLKKSHKTSKPSEQATTASSTSNSSSSNPSASQPKAQPKPQATTQPAPKAVQPQPKPAQPTIGSNKIGVNGIYKTYTNYGAASTDQLQRGINAGQIVAGITSFNGNDGQTTYFGGHNPGVMNFMASNLYVGTVVTVTDGSGNPYKYKMVDKVDVDVYGEGVLQSIGRSAIDVYMYGANTESILIQFCNTSNNLMSFWYGVKI